MPEWKSEKLVGENVKVARLRAGLSQDELAARMDVEQGYISRLEAGTRNPTIVTIAQIANALSVSPASLFIQDLAQIKGRRKRE